MTTRPLRYFSDRRVIRRSLATALLLGASLLLVAACGAPDRSPACPLGVGRGLWDLGSERREGGPAKNLLGNPNFGATPEAAHDLEAGVVDPRLVATLQTLAGKHRICVEAFKEGHQFRPGVPDGPRIPEGYGKAGGLPNTHYYGRAADIWWVDGKPVAGNGTDPDVLDLGRILTRIPPQRRPDQIIGPPDWTRALGSPRRKGWILAPDQLRLHRDHLHLGYMDENGTRNLR
jgi:hypothetical protein